MNNYTVDGSLDPLPLWTIVVFDILMIVTMVVAVAGNAVILLVEAFNKQMTSTDWLVGTLSANDILMAGFNIPVYIMFYNGTWGYVGSDLLCKLNAFIQDSFSYCATLLLSVMAIDRYIKTCHPYTQGITTRRAKWLCFGVVVATLIIGSPILFTFQFHEHALCRFVASAAFRQYTTGLFVFIQITFFAMFFVVIICYAKIAHVLRHKLKRTGVTMDITSNITSNSRVSPCHSSGKPKAVSGAGLTRMTYVSEQDTLDVVDNIMPDDKRNLTVPLPRIASLASATPTQHAETAEDKEESSISGLQNPAKRVNAYIKDSNDLETQKCTKDRLSHSKARVPILSQKNLQQKKVNRTTLIMFAVTLVFLLSWIPPWIVAAKWGTNYSTIMSDRIIILFARRAFIINTVTNPLFYIGMSSNFRAMTKTVLRKIWGRIHCTA